MDQNGVGVLDVVAQIIRRRASHLTSTLLVASLCYCWQWSLSHVYAWKVLLEWLDWNSVGTIVDCCEFL